MDAPVALVLEVRVVKFTDAALAAAAAAEDVAEDADDVAEDADDDAEEAEEDAADALAAAAAAEAEAAATVATLTVTSGFPVVELKLRTYPALVVLTGSVMSMVVGSVTGALIARSLDSATCWIRMTSLSSSSLMVLANRSPPVEKSVVRSTALAPTMVMLSALVAATTRVTEPVPLALIVTV